MEQGKRDYKRLLTEVIKKQMIILGPEITLSKARDVKGLKVDNDGNVTDMTGPPEELIKELINQFVQLSGLIVQKTMEPILASYPQSADSQVILTNIRAQIRQGGQEEEV